MVSGERASGRIFGTHVGGGENGVLRCNDHKWKWSDQRFDLNGSHPAGGMSFVATNAECDRCGARTWAHGRRG